MPRSFMITHRRFGECDLLSGNSSSNIINVEGNSEASDDRMHSDSPARSYTSYVPDSPELKKQRLIPGRGSDKSVNTSDGESDSGCSSQNDARHDLPLELEYTLGCPSGFSLLLELMTQSPQRYINRDVLDVNISSEAKYPSGQRLRKDDSQKEKVVNNFEVCPANTDLADKPESSKMHIHICSDNGLGLKAADIGRYVFEASENRNGFTECSVYPNDGDFPVCVSSKNRGQEMSGSLGISVNSHMTPVYDYQIYNGQEQKINNIQRKISFDEEMASVESVHRFSLSESQDEEEPIDYSQLSSRRKEKYMQRFNERDGIDQEMSRVKEEPNEKARQMSDDVYGATTKQAVGSVANKKYEFILSPKMDGNGNLVLSQSNKQIGRSIHAEIAQDFAAKDSEAAHSLQYTYPGTDNSSRQAIYSQQGSPLSGSPASPFHCSPDLKQETALDVAKAKFEHQKNHQETSGAGKSHLTYHPKLKYLLAVSQYAKAKDKQEESPILPTESTSSSFPSYQQPMLFSQDQTAQAHKSVKLNDHNENVYTRSEGGTSQFIPSSELFHNAPSCNRDNASASIINPTSSSPKACTSSIEISKGSKVIDNQQISHLPQTSSSPGIQISTTFNGSRPPSDHHHHHCESSLDMSNAMYVSSPDQPMSPASLRDQQAALSELLFSTNRKSGVDPYACVDCAKRYSTSSNLARHRQTHRSVCDKKARKCPHCDKVYVSMPAYSMHVRTHNQGCECPHCGKKFSRPWLLQGHIRTHTGEKPFGCPQCGKSFADKSNLRAHIQTHSTEKPYVCGRCGKAFALKSYLYKHEESSCMRGQRFRH